MAKATTLFVTAPNGEKLTRTTHRTYTHAIIARHSYDRALAHAATPAPVDALNFDYYVERADRGAAHPHFRSDSDLEQYVQIAARHTKESYVEMKRQERIQAVDALKRSGYYEKFEAMTWCGRPDLAQKELAAWLKKSWACDVSIAEVQGGAK